MLKISSLACGDLVEFTSQVNGLYFGHIWVRGLVTEICQEAADARLTSPFYGRPSFRVRVRQITYAGQLGPPRERVFESDSPELRRAYHYALGDAVDVVCANGRIRRARVVAHPDVGGGVNVSFLDSPDPAAILGHFCKYEQLRKPPVSAEELFEQLAKSNSTIKDLTASHDALKASFDGLHEAHNKLKSELRTATEKYEARMRDWAEVNDENLKLEAKLERLADKLERVAGSLRR